MNITNKDLTGRSAQELYALGLNEEERAARGIKTDLPYLSVDEIKMLYELLSFARLLLLVAQRALGKSDSDLEQLSDDLKKMNGWIDKINQGITASQDAKANKQDKVEWPDDFPDAITDMAMYAKEQGLSIDIKLNETDRGYWGELKSQVDLVIGQLQNISATLNTQVKNLTTKVQKENSTNTSFIELMSNLIKKFNDLFQGILRGLA